MKSRRMKGVIYTLMYGFPTPFLAQRKKATRGFKNCDAGKLFLNEWLFISASRKVNGCAGATFPISKYTALGVHRLQQVICNHGD